MIVPNPDAPALAPPKQAVVRPCIGRARGIRYAKDDMRGPVVSPQNRQFGHQPAALQASPSSFQAVCGRIASLVAACYGLRSKATTSANS
jgi:hypothetical protein